VQIAVPSRTRIDGYQGLNDDIREIAGAINSRWARGSWRPIHLCQRHVPQAELMALHRLSDFGLVTSLHDGMNLVAKEYIASRHDENGVLILSQFTGAARELTAAVPVNPFCSDEIAEAIHRALQMDRVERAERMRSLRAIVREKNVYAWASRVVRAVSEIRQRSAAWPDAEVFALASGL
jgi:trehalose-6-phosphate synthase